jgi:hypothetical protein
MLNAIKREQPQAAHRGPTTAFSPFCRARPIIHTAFSGDYRVRIYLIADAKAIP